MSKYKDYLITEELYSHAGAMGDFTSFVSDYASQHIDENNKVGSLINFFAPAMISSLFSAMGFGWMAKLIPFALSVLHVDIYAIIQTAFKSLKPAVEANKPVSSEEIKSAVESAMDTHSDGSSDEVKTSNYKRKVNLLKLAIHKKAAPSKGDFLSIISSIVSWLFRTAFAAAGFMVAGDIANKLVNRPNAIDGNLKGNENNSFAPVQEVKPVFTPKQTKFKAISGQDSKISNWSVSIPNNPDSIQNFLIQTARQSYDLSSISDSKIISSPNFQLIKSRITAYNRSSQGDSLVEIPPYFTSKKQLTDLFIDDLAQ
jgi:hypothetical protein